MRRRSRRDGNGPKPRTWRLGLLPVLFAFALLLAGSPAGEAGFLRLHLVTAHAEAGEDGGVEGHDDHQASPRPQPPEHDEHEHQGHGRHEHDHQQKHQHEQSPVDDARGKARSSLAPDTPHEHDGVVHTHEPRAAEDLVVPSDAVSKYYLSPPTAPVAAPAGDESRTPRGASSPDPVTSPVDTPPPRLPG